MSGNKYLLDTNFILGILKYDPIVLAEISSRSIHIGGELSRKIEVSQHGYFPTHEIMCEHCLPMHIGLNGQPNTNHNHP